VVFLQFDVGVDELVIAIEAGDEGVELGLEFSQLFFVHSFGD
jgi:hypothetical protein